MRQFVYDSWNGIMDANMNPLRHIPDTQVRHMVLQILAWMWCIVFSFYVGSFWVFGISMFAHTLFLAAVIMTLATFEVAEKKPISNHATVGIYYFKEGRNYVKAAEQMIDKNIRTNNEFYVCPVYNQCILNGEKVKIFDIDKKSMWGLGTPEDLDFFLKNHETNSA